MVRSRFLLPIVILALVSVYSSRAQEPVSHARIVRLSHTEGTAQLNGQPPIMNSPITEGAVLTTGADGLAEVQFEDGSVIRLASETQITFAQLARLSSGEAITRVDLDRGEAEFHIMGRTSQYAVEARGKNIQFQEPGRYRILSTDSNPLEIAVWNGQAAVRDIQSGKQVNLSKNQTFTLNPANLAQYDVQDSVLGDDLDRWSELRDQALSTAYPTSTYTYAPSGGGYVSTYSYAPYGIGLYGFNSCGFGFWGFNNPFWFGAPGNCFGGGAFPFSPWFFAPPVAVVVVPPVTPRRPPHIRPPVVPVPRATAGAVAIAPGARSFRLTGVTDPNVSESNPQPRVPRVQGAVPVAPARPPITPGVQVPAAETQRVISRPSGALIAPGQRSAGTVAAAPPTAAQPPVRAVQPAPPPPPPAVRVPAPSAPPRPPAAMPAPAPRSPGFSMPAPSHAPAPHAGGSGRH